MAETEEQVGIRKQLPPAQQNLVVLVNSDQQLVVTLKGDGRVEFGPGFTTNEEAARLFWECVGKWYRAALGAP